ncbi:hypothetical protein [Mycobacterium sp. 852002-51057_SCH5723018]|uniref:hypothetical protein n=1 Tax=Mycobacterium sp. 852002-51057_SCH5723018 TaxID=1834094 RepID=UPI0007FDAC00|nr:hypothetical protein [Mycobacterium sp. 852002-51057_SCH5723018]OBG28735.1 hypothetical protein A5764_24325 [Mycobacterium sp. 852002-51057_SCH5723018]
MSADKKRNEIDLTVHPLAPLNPEAMPRSTNTTQIIGFVGPSDVEDHLRIYTDLSFSTFYDIDETDVVRAARVDTQDGNSPTVVHVDSSAHIEFVYTSRIAGGADYVTGAVARLYAQVVETDDKTRVWTPGPAPRPRPTVWECATQPPRCTPIFCPTQAGSGCQAV